VIEPGVLCDLFRPEYIEHASSAEVLGVFGCKLCVPLAGFWGLLMGLWWVSLLDHAKNTVIKMLVERLCIREHNATSRTSTCNIADNIVRQVLVSSACDLVSLFDAVHACQVSLKDVCAIETFFGC
jgi:hypothetical protein